MIFVVWVTETGSLAVMAPLDFLVTVSLALLPISNNSLFSIPLLVIFSPEASLSSSLTSTNMSPMKSLLGTQAKTVLRKTFGFSQF